MINFKKFYHLLFESTKVDINTQHFSVKFTEGDGIYPQGKIFFKGQYFANAVKQNDDWGKYAGKWTINRAGGAFEMKFPSWEEGYDNLSDLLAALETWYSSTQKPLTESFDTSIPYQWESKGAVTTAIFNVNDYKYHVLCILRTPEDLAIEIAHTPVQREWYINLNQSLWEVTFDAESNIDQCSIFELTNLFQSLPVFATVMNIITDLYHQTNTGFVFSSDGNSQRGKLYNRLSQYIVKKKIPFLEYYNFNNTQFILYKLNEVKNPIS